MLQSLHISNYALISTLDIDFARGLNIITGETGAGKSVILGALSMLLGARADLKAMRDPAAKSVVEAVFSIDGNETVAQLLQQNDIDPCDGSGQVCIIRRELLPSGSRSRAFINDTPVNLGLLQQVTSLLVDIHSQHQNLLLSNPDYQLSILDTVAGTGPVLKEYSEAYSEYRRHLKTFADTRDMITRRKADTEYISYQLERLNELNLQPGEQQQLEQQRRLLADMSQVKTNIETAIDALSTRQDSAASLLSTAITATGALDGLVPEAEAMAKRLDTALIEVNDIADTLMACNATLAADPDTIDRIEQRLEAIYALESRYKVDSSDALIALRDDLASQLQAITDSDGTLAALEARAREAKKAAMLIARKLSSMRADAAARLQDILCERARPLGLPNLQCVIDIPTTRLTPSGIDQVQFLFAFNKNQTPIPVGSGASGGEISRLVFAVKSILGEVMNMPTIIFDEVDSGISGDIAGRMGQMMLDISRHIQVIVITHLPQIASKGDIHFKVYKTDSETATLTGIRRLDHDGRIAELALMLSGNPDDPSARLTAQSLLDNVSYTQIVS